MVKQDPAMLDLLPDILFRAMAVHLIMLPAGMRDDAPRAVVWDDEAGTVGASVFVWKLGDPGTGRTGFSCSSTSPTGPSSASLSAPPAKIGHDFRLPLAQIPHNSAKFRLFLEVATIFASPHPVPQAKIKRQHYQIRRSWRPTRESGAAATLSRRLVSTSREKPGAPEGVQRVPRP